MARKFRKCNHCGDRHYKKSAAKRCAAAAKKRKGGKAWSDKELGV